MILSVGEILADMIGSRRGKTVQYECFAGGAPFNVACGVARLGGEVAFCGCVGKDEIGKFLKAYAENERGLAATSPFRRTEIPRWRSLPSAKAASAAFPFTERTRRTTSLIFRVWNPL